MVDFAEMNDELRRKCRVAPGKLWRMSGSDWDLKRYADWFEDIYIDVVDLLQEDEMEDETVWEALNACSEILELAVEHMYHLKYLVRIREWLRPGEIWDDYPYDVSGLLESEEEESEEEEESDSDESTQFRFDDL